MGGMDDALRYVSEYVAEPRILASLEAGDPLMKELPAWWQRVLLATGAERIRKTVEAWDRHGAPMARVVGFLAKHLVSVNLLIDKTSVRLLYELRKDGQTMYYAGGNPQRKKMSDAVRSVWDKLPAELREFYDSLHDGWYYLASQSMGPLPSDCFFILDDMEWGILDDIGDPGCDLKDLLAVYGNGMGAYVALSVEGKGAYGDVLWMKDQAPMLNVDAWAVMDAWTEIGLTG
jgi:hypothetical protein